MIKKISLSNFKLHDDTEINMGGLTVLTGMNGMGKPVGGIKNTAEN